jgi:aspartyl/asparaginyl beta-hydroxylase (cupin superfamily)
MQTQTTMPMRTRLWRSFKFKVADIFEWPLGRFSLVGNHTFFKSEQFPWVAEIEANWQEIRAELDEILKYQDEIPAFQQISSSQGVLTQGNDWKTFMFYGYGYKEEPNCQRCPKTTALIEKIPDMKTAFFSILVPGKHIPPHRGPYKGVLRYHLGLLVPGPREKIRIRVGDDYAHWEEGKSLIFDDSFEHEVWNDSDGVRVILFVDFVRPLPFPISAWNKLVIQMIAWSPFVQEGRKNQRKWYEKVGKKVKMAN